MEMDEYMEIIDKIHNIRTETDLDKAKEMLRDMHTKHRPKFKVGDRVKMDTINGYEYGVVERISDDIEGGLYFYDLDNGYFHVRETLLSLVESKPKWSVGTYVEFLEDFYPYNKGEIFKINKGRVGSAIKLELYSDVCLVKTFTNTKIGMIGLEKANIIKWHENKPEKEYPDATNEITKEHIQEDLEEERNIICGSGFWKHLEHAASQFDYDSSNYSTGEFDMATLDVVRKYMTSQRVQPPYRIFEYPMTPDECWSSILSKPQIKISKQKKINININKPKI